MVQRFDNSLLCSNYPSEDKDFNLNNIKILKNRYKCRIGFSDHSKNNKIAFSLL